MSHIEQLTLTAFRNYQSLRLDVGPHSIVLTGKNGAGKTNLLEAISLLGPGRGLRNAKLADVGMIKHPLPDGRGRGPSEGWEGEGADGMMPSVISAACLITNGNMPLALTRPFFASLGTVDLSHRGEVNQRWAVSAAIHTQAGTRTIGTGQEDSVDRRIVRIDGVGRAQGALAEICSVLWITPAMDRLFAEASSARRKFLDRIVYGYDPAHATRLNRYEQALRERQKLLEQDRHPAWLDGIEAVLAETSVAVAASRIAVAAKLNQACVSVSDFSFPIPTIAVSGDVETYLGTHSALLTEDWLRAGLAASRGLDAASSRCSIGVHRSDMMVHMQERNMPAALCSTGEQKALLIALVLANAALLQDLRGDKPILLLDEITAHLDEGRRLALFERIASLGLQAWMTGTERKTFPEINQEILYRHVEEGRLTSE